MSFGFSGQIFNWLILLCLAGALLLSAKQLRRFFLWRNRVRRCIAITGGRVHDVFLESKRFARLEHRPVVLRDCGGVLPVAACFGTPRRGTVLCPLEKYAAIPDAELRMILIHELEHLRRYDNPVAFFLTLVANLLYLNGVVRFLVGRWAMVAELDCDEKVRSALRLDRRGEAQYAELLLASQSGGRVALPGCGLGSSARILKLRIQECFMKRSRRQLFARFAGITLLFCLGVLLLPELRAGVPREPVPEFVAAHLPADTHSLVLFRTKDLDEQGTKLLQKAYISLSSVNVPYPALQTGRPTGGTLEKVNYNKKGMEKWSVQFVGRKPIRLLRFAEQRPCSAPEPEATSPQPLEVRPEPPSERCFVPAWERFPVERSASWSALPAEPWPATPSAS